MPKSPFALLRSGLLVMSLPLFLVLAVSGSLVLAWPPPLESSGGGSRQPATQPALLITDQYGDPVPTGALARLGTARLRHKGAVTCVVFAPDGKSLASAGEGVVHLWDSSSSKPLRTIEGHKVSVCAFASNGELLASAGYDGIVRLWNAASGKLIRALDGQTVWVRSVVFAPDGKSLALADKHTVQLWDVASGKHLRTLRGNHDGISLPVFAADGKSMATAGNDGSIVIWDATTGKLLHTLNGHKGGDSGGVSSLNFSSDGRFLASAGDKVVRLWDRATGKLVHALSGHEGWVSSVAFAPDGKALASGGHDGVVRLWDVASGKPICSMQAPDTGVTTLVFAPHGRSLASGNYDGTVRLWEATNGKPLHVLKRHRSWVNSLVFAADGKRVASGGEDGTVGLWDAVSGTPVHAAEEHSGTISSVVIAPDGQSLATGGYEGTTRLWEAASGKPIRVVEGHDPVFAHAGKSLATIADKSVRLWDIASGKPGHHFNGHEHWIHLVVCSPDGKTLASAGRDGSARLWDAERGKPSHRLTGHVRHLVFSPNCNLLATSGDHGTVGLWDVGSGKLVRALTGHKGAVNHVVFAPDGKVLASASEDGTVRLWDMADGKSFGIMKQERWVRSVAFSPDGKLLASSSAGLKSSGSVQVWEAASGKLRFTLENHNASFVLFAPDSKSLATTVSRSVRLWDVYSGNLIHAFEGHLDWVRSLAYAPDGKSLASVSEDNTVLIWDTLTFGESPVLPKQVSQGAFDALWVNLADQDSAKAYRAIGALAMASDRAMPYLQGRLQPVPLPDGQRLERLIDGLESDNFRERDQANRELEKMGDAAIPALRDLLANKPNLEVSRRIEQLLKRTEVPPAGAELQALRGVQVLERIGTPAAAAVLADLARGGNARLTRDAKAALERLTCPRTTP